ncbi:MAG: hypothetical protein CBD42_006720 [Gammaproteobacteria bacterium TMED182]|nr:hypothetical protein [Gammaproteobacteria bacterium]RPG51204.1 MAG: hypothetical protein CBD42_006720 [Gammaproteobacteria bacterium TMED182]
MFRKLTGLVTMVCLIPFSFADDHSNTWRGVDLNQQFGIQFEICKLKPGQSIEDIAKLDKEVSRLFAKNAPDLSIMRLTPMYSHGMPGDSGASYIDITMGAIEAFGTGWDQWMASKPAQKLMANSNEIADCTFKFTRAVNRVANKTELDASDNRLISMNWCSKRDNVGWNQLKAKHDAWQAAYEDDASSMAWNVVLPRLGTRSVNGRFMHMVSYANATQLMANENWVANQGGGQALADYYSAYASCDGESVWNASYLYRSEG